MIEKGKSDAIDEALEAIEAGAKAGGAKPYLLDYLKDAKMNMFTALVNTPPTPEALLRVWGAAQGIANLERDLEETITEGAQARAALNTISAPAEAGQAEQ